MKLFAERKLWHGSCYFWVQRGANASALHKFCPIWLSVLTEDVPSIQVWSHQVTKWQHVKAVNIMTTLENHETNTGKEFRGSVRQFTDQSGLLFMMHLLISVDSESAAVPLSYGGKNRRVGTDHSRMDDTDLHVQVKATRCKLFPSAVTVKFQRTQTALSNVAVQTC